MMTAWNQLLENRRQTQRVDSTGSAIVHLPDRALRARIIDLSTGGVSLHVDLGRPPDESDHLGVDVDLCLDGGHDRVRVAGHVLRVDPDNHGHRVVIAFDTLPIDFEDVVQDEVLASLEVQRLIAETYPPL